eukprot:754866-Hanusia_phi.AAC.1
MPSQLCQERAPNDDGSVQVDESQWQTRVTAANPRLRAIRNLALQPRRNGVNRLGSHDADSCVAGVRGDRTSDGASARAVSGPGAWSAWDVAGISYRGRALPGHRGVTVR